MQVLQICQLYVGLLSPELGTRLNANSIFQLRKSGIKLPRVWAPPLKLIYSRNQTSPCKFFKRSSLLARSKYIFNAVRSYTGWVLVAGSAWFIARGNHDCKHVSKHIRFHVEQTPVTVSKAQARRSWNYCLHLCLSATRCGRDGAKMFWEMHDFFDAQETQ